MRLGSQGIQGSTNNSVQCHVIPSKCREGMPNFRIVAKLRIGFFQTISYTTQHTIHPYSYFYTKPTIDRRASPNPITMYKESSHKQNALKIYVQSECTKNQCIRKPHWMVQRNRLNTRKYIGCTNSCKGVICCMHHSHFGHEVECATAWQLECIHADCSRWNSPCLASTNLM